MNAMRRTGDDTSGGASRRRAPAIRLLLTGFGPFPGMPVNASAELVDALAQRLAATHTATELRIAILPTEWKAGPAALQRAIAAFMPDVALHFGVASEVTGFRLETMAENARNRLPDACGHVPRRRQISTDAPAHLLATFPVEGIRARLAAMGLPVELSTDAGQYLCNAALFRSLSLTRRGRGARLSGFVHIPSALGSLGDASATTLGSGSGLAPVAASVAASSLQSLDWSCAVAGGLAIVETCLAHAQSSADVAV